MDGAFVVGFGDSKLFTVYVHEFKFCCLLLAFFRNWIKERERVEEFMVRKANIDMVNILLCDGTCQLAAAFISSLLLL